MAGYYYCPQGGPNGAVRLRPGFVVPAEEERTRPQAQESLYRQQQPRNLRDASSEQIMALHEAIDSGRASPTGGTLY